MRLAALKKQSEIWSGPGSYNSRVAKLTASDFAFALNSTSVTDDGAKDRLLGNAGLDWFFANAIQDLLNDRKNGERLN